MLSIITRKGDPGVIFLKQDLIPHRFGPDWPIQHITHAFILSDAHEIAINITLTALWNHVSLLVFDCKHSKRNYWWVAHDDVCSLLYYTVTHSNWHIQPCRTCGWETNLKICVRVLTNKMYLYTEFNSINFDFWISMLWTSNERFWKIQ